MKSPFQIISCLLGIVIFCTVSHSSSGPEELIWRDRSFGLLDIDLISIDIDYSGKRILTASEHSVYLTETLGENWRLVYEFSQIDTPEQDQTTASDDYNDQVEFDPSDYDTEELRESGILEEDEDIDNVDEDDLKSRLLEAGLLDGPDERRFRNNAPQESETIPRLSVQGTINQVVWDPADPQYAYLATDQGIFFSDDFGRNWNLITGNKDLMDTNVSKIAALSSPGYLIAYAGNSLYSSKDFGNTFIKLDYPELSAGITDFELDDNRRRVLIATADSQIFTLDIKHQLTKFGSYKSSKDQLKLQLTGSSVQNFMVTNGEKIFYLQNSGNWSALPRQSLLATRLNDMLLTQRYLGIATDRGVYLWDRIHLTGNFSNRGLLDLDVRDITNNPTDPNQMWLATSTGIYSLERYEGQQTSVDSKSIPTGLPDFSLVLTAALKYAEIQTIQAAKFANAIDRLGCFPQIELRLQYDDRNLEGYACSDIVTFKDGHPYLGPIDEVYSRREQNFWDVALGMRWFPQDFSFNNDKLKARRQIAKDIARRNDLVESVLSSYRALLQELHLRNNYTQLHQRLISQLKVEQLIAELDGLTGFEFNLTDSNLSRGIEK